MTTTIKLYTFMDEYDQIIEEVRAENHDMAVARCTVPWVNCSTDFYSGPAIQSLAHDAEHELFCDNEGA